MQTRLVREAVVGVVQGFVGSSGDIRKSLRRKVVADLAKMQFLMLIAISGLRHTQKFRREAQRLRQEMEEVFVLQALQQQQVYEPITQQQRNCIRVLVLQTHHQQFSIHSPVRMNVPHIPRQFGSGFGYGTPQKVFAGRMACVGPPARSTMAPSPPKGRSSMHGWQRTCSKDCFHVW